MPRSFGENQRRSAADIAAALMTEDVAQEPVAQEELPQLEETPEAVSPPERRTRRDATGRFAPSEASVPTEPQAITEPGTAEPAAPEVDYRAELDRQRAENDRLRRTYENNTRQQREALENARREAEALRQAKATERERLLEDARAEVAAIPDHDPRKALAERQLANIELEEASRIRREAEAERTELEAARQTEQTQRVDTATRVGSWGVIEEYAKVFGGQLGLPPEEQAAALDAIKTPELAILFRTMPPQQLIEHVRDVVGHRLHTDLERRAQTLTTRKAQDTERNRQEVVAAGTHGHARMPAPSSAPQPAYVAYTRDNKHAKLGRRAAAEAILNGILDE